MSHYDVQGIGNALVDTEYGVDDTFLADIEAAGIDTNLSRDLCRSARAA